MLTTKPQGPFSSSSSSAFELLIQLSCHGNENDWFFLQKLKSPVSDLIKKWNVYFTFPWQLGRLYFSWLGSRDMIKSSRTATLWIFKCDCFVKCCFVRSRINLTELQLQHLFLLQWSGDAQQSRRWYMYGIFSARSYAPGCFSVVRWKWTLSIRLQSKGKTLCLSFPAPPIATRYYMYAQINGSCRFGGLCSPCHSCFCCIYDK